MSSSVRRAIRIALLMCPIAAAACSARGCGGGAPDTKPAAPPNATGGASTTADSARPPVPPADEKSIADAAAFITQSAAAPLPAALDVDKSAADAGSDPASLFAFVHDRIRTEIYP